ERAWAKGRISAGGPRRSWAGANVFQDDRAAFFQLQSWKKDGSDATAGLLGQGQVSDGVFHEQVEPVRKRQADVNRLEPALQNLFLENPLFLVGPGLLYPPVERDPVGDCRPKLLDLTAAGREARHVDGLV